ncbi:hypothetical protein Tco_1451633 [Tanacetum coccineum]
MGGTAVSWMSRIQKCVAMSTTEAEYMAIVEAGKELVWLKNFLKELDRAQTECFLFCDNQSAIHLMKNPVFHGQTKHIRIRYHYIREPRVSYVWRYMKVRAIALLKGRWFKVYRDYLRQRA